MLCCALLKEFSAVDESGGAGGVVLRESNLRGTRDVGCVGVGVGVGAGVGVVLPCHQGPPPLRRL
jgi:hypothetical protein